jgi:hypothetical protein
MKALVGAAAFGLVPVPTIPSVNAYTRNCRHRSIKADVVAKSIGRKRRVEASISSTPNAVHARSDTTTIKQCRRALVAFLVVLLSILSLVAGR